MYDFILFFEFTNVVCVVVGVLHTWIWATAVVLMVHAHNCKIKTNICELELVFSLLVYSLAARSLVQFTTSQTKSK